MEFFDLLIFIPIRLPNSPLLLLTVTPENQILEKDSDTSKNRLVTMFMVYFNSFLFFTQIRPL